jgi:N-acetylmuramoyl-L-alanine amidase
MACYKEDFIVKNEFSRPGIKLIGVKGIVMHYTATPGATDQNEHDFFDGKDGGGGRYASAHFFVDRDSATLIIPLDEVAYHANEHACKVDNLKATAPYYKNGGANLTSIGIEMCVEKDGTIHGSTVKRAEQVAAELCKKFNLEPKKDIYRHYDITGKVCPKPWVDHPALFTQFVKDVDKLVHPDTYVIQSGDNYWNLENKLNLSHGTLKKFESNR